MHIKWIRCRVRSVVIFLLFILSLFVYLKFKTFIDVALANFAHRNYLIEHAQFQCHHSNVDSNVSKIFLLIDDFFVSYNAYHDIDGENFIRILGLRYILTAPPIFCAIFQIQDDKLVYVSLIKGHYVFINQNPACLNPKLCTATGFDAYYVKCPLPKQPLNSLAVSVALINSSYIETVTSCQTISTLPKLKVHMRKDIRHANATNFLSVCISPVHNFDNINLLQFFFNHYIHHGVEKFIVYKRSWSDGVNNLLKSLKLRNYVEIVDWPLFPHAKSFDLNDNRLVHYFGQNLAINDCIWRMKYHSDFVLSIDLDEFIVFNDENLTISRMLRNLLTDNVPFSGVMFKNRFANFDLTNISASNPVHLDKKIWHIYGQRSKVLVKPEKVDLFAIHRVWRFKKKQRADGDSIEEPLIMGEREQSAMIHWRSKTSSDFEHLEKNATEMRKIFPYLFRSQKLW
uniref:Glycosyltransferase family 92 protein n=1 Tax=Romanomermis culicivorax TaxID=13658 RepID=A0A915KI95_ROMCU